MLQIIYPLPLINIPITVSVHSKISIVIFELPYELIPVEQFQNSSSFIVVLPLAFEQSTLSEIILTFTMLLAIHKLTDIPVLVSIFQISNSIREILPELSDIYTAISIDDFTVAFFSSMLKLSLVDVAEDVDEHSFAVPPPFKPLTLIFFLFLWNFISPVTMLQIIQPASRIVGSVSVVVFAHALL